MFLRYNGKTPNFKYKGADFSEGPAEVDNATGKKWLKESPMSFTEVVKEKPAEPAKPAKPAKPAEKNPTK